MLSRFAEQLCPEVYLRTMHPLREAYAEVAELFMSVEAVVHLRASQVRYYTDCFTCVLIWLLMGFASVWLGLRFDSVPARHGRAYSDD